MKSLSLFNTLSRKKEPFVPIASPLVTMYTCGPTVYNYAHIGNLRTYLFEDILERTLRYSGYTVKRVMNITDVGHLTSDEDTGEDKMEKGARREGRTVWDIAQHYTDAFFADLTALNCLIPDTDHLPRATDYIAPMIELIKTLDDNGYTYETSDGIYFDTGKFPTYPDFAMLDTEGLREGARVCKNDEKRNSTDFALWKRSPEGEQRQMEWESPWGTGFPGWHLECSAMAMQLLGETIDIHCGGIDHIPVHHTNEIAQSECATGKPFARYWLHGEWLVIGDSEEKMAKSGDNFITLATLKEKGISAAAYRYFCLMTHYRSKLHFSYKALKAAEQGRLHILRSLNALVPPNVDWVQYQDRVDLVDPTAAEHFERSITDDLNTPQALDLLGKVLRDGALSWESRLATLLSFDAVLGLDILGMKLYRYEGAVPISSEQPLDPDFLEKLQPLIIQRAEARSQKDWGQSDAIRDRIFAEFSLSIEDTPEGIVLKLH